MKRQLFLSTSALLLVVSTAIIPLGAVKAQELPVRDFVSLGIYFQTAREYYLLPESMGEYWMDSTQTALQWTSNALFDCNAPEELKDQVKDLKAVIAARRRPQTLEEFFELEKTIHNFVQADSVAQAAYECGSYLGQLRFYLPRFMSEEEDVIKKELWGRLAEDAYIMIKRDRESWDPMVQQYAQSAVINSLASFLNAIKYVGGLTKQKDAEAVRKELNILLQDAAKVLVE